MKTTHKSSKRILQLTLALALVGVALPAVSRQSQAPPSTQEQFPPLIRSLKGPDLYKVYCATCHGTDGKGDGPVAQALKNKVPDLTILARNNGMKYPADLVRHMIVGDVLVAAHGSREMPIWGPIFHQVEKDMDWGDVRVSSLVEYIQSIQINTAPIVPSGADLYYQNCAVCHGGNLKGTNPGPSPFKSPPDLTTLARTHGGKFPDDYVKDVLRNGVVFRAHGPVEMPIWGTDFIMDRLGERQVALRIANLTEFIKSRQVK